MPYGKGMMWLIDWLSMMPPMTTLLKTSIECPHQMFMCMLANAIGSIRLRV